MLIPVSKTRPFVLLTGATGLVGGLLLARLLSCEVPVAVLVRGSRRQTAAERLEDLMQRLEYRCERLFVRPVCLNGDLCLPFMGLSASERSWISENCGSVIHSAASLSFRPAKEHSDNEPFRTNVDGTRQLQKVLAEAGVTEWHYVSTAYTAGLRTGRILERDCDTGQNFGNDYERSKVLAEQILREAPEIRSLTVYRPSIVIDVHPRAGTRSDQTIHSAFAMYQALSQRFGLPERRTWLQRLGLSGSERKNIVTADWVCRMIAQIWRRPQLHGRTYHLTSPVGTLVSDLDDSFHEAATQSGLRFPERRSHMADQLEELAAPFVVAFHPYFRDDPVFDRRNTTDAAMVCGEADVPALTVEQLSGFCLRQTKLPPAAGSLPMRNGDAATGHPACLTGIAAAAVTMTAGLPLGHHQVIIPAAPRGPAGQNRPESGGGSVTAHDLSGGRTHCLTARNEAFGLMLAGSGGGQWVVRLVDRQYVVQTGSAACESAALLCSVETWNALNSGVRSVSEAIASAELLIELNGGPETDAWAGPALSGAGRSGVVGSDQWLCEILRSFENFLNAMRSLSSGRDSSLTETVHVG